MLVLHSRSSILGLLTPPFLDGAEPLKVGAGSGIVRRKSTRWKAVCR